MLALHLLFRPFGALRHQRMLIKLILSTQIIYRLEHISYLGYIQIMNSIGSLEKRAELLRDQIGDIFHATELNLSALQVQLEPFEGSRTVQAAVQQCKKDFQTVKYLFQDRGTLRLEYLITQQIKEEEAKVRRQRLIEYEEKIYDQRRLIADKELFYDGLLKPRKRRPAHMTIEEFQNQRRQELMADDKKNLKRLQEQINELKHIEKTIAKDNDRLQKILEKLESDDIPEQELATLASAIQKNPIIYDNINNVGSKKEDKQQIKKLLQYVTELEKSSQDIYKQYHEEKQLHQFLRWQYSRLKEEYNKKGEQNLHQQAQRRLKLQKIGNYHLRRSTSL